jgi:hypothetical protein
VVTSPLTFSADGVLGEFAGAEAIDAPLSFAAGCLATLKERPSPAAARMKGLFRQASRTIKPTTFGITEMSISISRLIASE